MDRSLELCQSILNVADEPSPLPNPQQSGKQARLINKKWVWKADALGLTSHLIVGKAVLTCGLFLASLDS